MPIWVLPTKYTKQYKKTLLNTLLKNLVKSDTDVSRREN